MANEYDPYREALVVEKVFRWALDSAEVSPELRAAVEGELDRRPQLAADLAYVRLPTGFRREITITKEDVDRIRNMSGDSETVTAAHPSVQAFSTDHSLSNRNDATPH